MEHETDALIWYEDHFPLGALIKGSALKHLAEQKLFATNYALIDNAVIHAGEVDFSEIDLQDALQNEGYDEPEFVDSTPYQKGDDQP